MGTKIAAARMNRFFLSNAFRLTLCKNNTSSPDKSISTVLSKIVSNSYISSFAVAVWINYNKFIDKVKYFFIFT